MKKTVLIILAMLMLGGCRSEMADRKTPDVFFGIDLSSVTSEFVIRELNSKNIKFEKSPYKGVDVVICNKFIGVNIDEKKVSRVIYDFSIIDDDYVDIEIEMPRKYYEETIRYFDNNLGKSKTEVVKDEAINIWTFDGKSAYSAIYLRQTPLLYHSSVKDGLMQKSDMYYVLFRSTSRKGAH